MGVSTACASTDLASRYVSNSDGHHRHALPERSAALFLRGSSHGVFSLWQAVVCTMI